jgi:hypothetical protein
MHSNEEWRVIAKKLEIAKGNNKAKLIMHVKQDKKR